jgi:hypothetical protein
MEQGLREWGQEPAGDAGTALRAQEHRLHPRGPAQFCAAQAETGFPGEAAEAGYMEAEESADGGAGRHRITPALPMHSPLLHLMQRRK